MGADAEVERPVKRERAGRSAQVSAFGPGANPGNTLRRAHVSNTGVTEAPGAQPAPRQAFTIAEFCEAFRISRAMLYILLREGRGPAVFKCGRRTLISIEAAAAWRAKLEAESTKATA